MEQKTRHALCIFVENEFGVLQRLTGLFSARGISIEAMHTETVDEKENASQVSITLYETPEKVTLMTKLLMKILIVHDVLHLDVPSIDCPPYISEVFRVKGDFSPKADNILSKSNVAVFRMVSDDIIYVISGPEPEIAALRNHLEKLQSVIFTKKYNIL